MKILVLGGTGAMGKNLVEILANEGHCLTVTSRCQHQSLDPNVSYVKGNAHDITFLKFVLAGNSWDAIIDFMVYSTPEFLARNELLLSATAQYIFLSSSRVYADNPILNEESNRILDTTSDAEYLKTDEYALTKARQENILIKSKFKNWTIIRPYITFSDERLQLGVFEKEDWLYRAIHGRKIVFPKNMANCYTTMTLGSDVAKVIFAVVGNASAYQKVLQITSDQTILWKDILDLYTKTISKFYNREPKIKWIEDMGFLCLVMQNKYQVNVDRMYNRKFKSNKIHEFCGQDFAFSKIDEELPACLERFLSHPRFRTIDWGTQAYMDRLSGEFTPCREIPSFSQKVKYLLFRFSPIKVSLFLRNVIRDLRN